MTSLPPSSKTIITTPGQWPATPQQQFFADYVQAVQRRDLDKAVEYYSRDVFFENCNGAIYNGRSELREWFAGLFAPFERIEHTFRHCIVVSDYDDKGRTFCHMRFERQLWMKGNKGETPDVRSPMSFNTLIGPAVKGEGATGLELQMDEVWFFWDTGPLMKFMAKAAVAFSQENVTKK